MTYAELQKEVMKYARKNNLDDMEAARLLRSRAKSEGVELPEGSATEQEFKKQEREAANFKKAEMRYGGMANGKKHNYACGGSVHSKM